MDVHLSFHSGNISSTPSNDIKAASVCIIEFPPKIWIPKQENKYGVTDYSNDIDDKIFDYKAYGKSLSKPKLYWESRNRDYVIVFYENIHSGEFMKYMIVGYIVYQPPKYKNSIIIKDFGGCFCKEWLHWNIIRYEFENI